MSDVHADTAGQPASALGGQGTAGDYYALMKPRVMYLVIFTAFVGMMAAPGSIHPWLGFMAILAIAIGAGAAGALNMWLDADIDAVMKRTARRPVPRGAILPGEALGFGMTLAVGSVLLLGLVVNLVAAAILAFTIFFYVVIYTLWLKRWTPQNIVIGGAAGAFPPVIGWASVTGSVDLGAIALFLIIFMWTPPHFWALALWKNVNADYSRAGVPMLPVIAGADETRRQIMVYTLLVFPVTLLPAAIGTAGLFYAVSGAILSAVFVYRAWNVYRYREGQEADRALKKMFGYSIYWLFLVYAALLVERLAGLPSLPSVFG
jgi:protoheme IX farnesyltransferase